jgi:hypothetical protein
MCACGGALRGAGGDAWTGGDAEQAGPQLGDAAGTVGGRRDSVVVQTGCSRGCADGGGDGGSCRYGGGYGVSVVGRGMTLCGSIYDGWWKEFSS